jgi:hypothetical protein
MFVVGQYKSSWVPVVFHGLDEAGARIEHSFDIQVKLRGRDAGLAFVAAVQAGAPDGISKVDAEAALLLDWLSDWRGVAQEGGATATLGAETLKAVLDVPGVFDALLIAILNAQVGEVVSRIKNSPAPDGSGPSAGGQDIARTA